MALSLLSRKMPLAAGTVVQQTRKVPPSYVLLVTTGLALFTLTIILISLAFESFQFFQF